MVKEEEKDLLIKNYKFDCRSCGKKNLKRVVSLGYQPLANNLLNKKDLTYFNNTVKRKTDVVLFSSNLRTGKEV